MSAALWIAFVLFLLAIIFPFIAFKFRPRSIALSDPRDDYAELKASVLFLNTALPTLLFLLGALGFTTYDNVVTRITREATDEVRRYIGQETIDSLVTETKMRRDQAGADAEIVKALKESLQDSVDRMLAYFLPRGAIIPYFGRNYNIDRNT